MQIYTRTYETVIYFLVLYCIRLNVTDERFLDWK